MADNLADDNQEQAGDTAIVPAPEFVPFTVTNKRGESFLVDGVNYRQLDNGTIISVSSGRMVANPESGKLNGFTSTESSRDARQKWFDRRISGAMAAGRGLALATNSPEEITAIERLTAEQATLAMDISRGRASTEAYVAIMRVAGFLGTMDKSKSADQGSNNTLSLTDEGLKELRLFIQTIRGMDGDG
jgi:hypothetical protein